MKPVSLIVGCFPSTKNKQTKNCKKIVAHSGGGIYRQLSCEQKNDYLKRDVISLFNIILFYVLSQCSLIFIISTTDHDVNRKRDSAVPD